MIHEPSSSTGYFDGGCPLCRAEIGYYRGQDRSGALRFVDVSQADAALPVGVTRPQALRRFHVRAVDGRLRSGAAAFVEVWARLPGWRWAARAAALPGALAVLELGYRLFLPVRPFVSRLFGRLTRRYGVIPVDREAGAKALREMLADAKAAKATGRPVVIYPEGTRVAPGTSPPLRAGFAGLYRALGLPVVPVALDSGRLFPRGLLKCSGTIHFKVGEVIPAGLRREEVEARVHAAINALEGSTP